MYPMPRFNKLQTEAQRIIEATRTPMELYNRELLNKLLEKVISIKTHLIVALGKLKNGWRVPPRTAPPRLKKNLPHWGISCKIIGDALGNISTEFDSFGDFFKGFMKDIGTSLSQTFIKDLTGKVKAVFLKICWAVCSAL